jgi:hypothetical protein
MNFDSECYKKRGDIITLINEEKWHLIDEYVCSINNCRVCNNPVIKSDMFPIGFLFNKNNFNSEIQNTIERIYIKMNYKDQPDKTKLKKEEWFLLIIKIVPKINVLSYFIENNLINPNHGSEQVTLLELYCIYKDQHTQYLDYILSQEVGFNINLQNSYGENVILSTLRLYFYQYEQTDYVFERYNRLINYLLERGADPLLEDKEGISPIQYVIDLKTFDETQKIHLIKILKKYC